MNAAETTISIVIPCHNGGSLVLETVAALERLKGPADRKIEIIVVDDASTDGSREMLEAGLPTPNILVSLGENQGRGGALNQGVAHTSGGRVLILDCDCLPATPDFLERHLEVLDQGAHASVGTFNNPDKGFWSWYQNQAFARRARQFRSGMVYAMTSANLMIDRSWFTRIGGFDDRYRRYGFEDRDLFLRLQREGAVIRLAEHAIAEHRDHGVRLSTVCCKMREAGKSTATLFREAHPEAYRALGYDRIDAEMHPWLHPFGRLLGPAGMHLARSLDPWLKQNRIPRRPGACLVKACSAACFLHGTTERQDSSKPA